MSVLHISQPVEEKFRSYKVASAFRNKSDAELLNYLLDSFEVIECIVDGLKGCSPVPPPAEPPLLPHPNQPNRTDTDVPVNRIQCARKTTPKPRKSTKFSKKIIDCKTSSETSGNFENQAAEPAINTAVETYVSNWRASVRRSIRISQNPPTNGPTKRRKSIQNTANAGKPPPLSFTPLTVIKTEPIDEGTDQISSLSSNDISGITSTSSNDISGISTSNEGPVSTSESYSESYDRASIMETLNIRKSREEALQTKAREAFSFDSSNPEPNVSSASNTSVSFVNKTISGLQWHHRQNQTTDVATSVHHKRTNIICQRSTAIPISKIITDKSHQRPVGPQKQYLKVPRSNNHPSNQNNIILYRPLHAMPDDHTYTKSRNRTSHQIVPVTCRPRNLTMQSNDTATNISLGRPIAPKRFARFVITPKRLTSLSSASMPLITYARKNSTAGKSMEILTNMVTTSAKIGCNICYKMFDSKTEFHKHIKTVSTSKDYDPLTHHLKAPINCSFCKAVFSSSQGLSEHQINSCHILNYSNRMWRDTPAQPGIASAKCNTAKSPTNIIKIANIASHPDKRSRPFDEEIRSRMRGMQSAANILEVELPRANKRLFSDIIGPPCLKETHKRRSFGNLYSETCLSCKLKFCECSISGKKFKTSYKRKASKPCPTPPSTEPPDNIDVPFPFNIEIPSSFVNELQNNQPLYKQPGIDINRSGVLHPSSAGNVEESVYESTSHSPTETPINDVSKEGEFDCPEVIRTVSNQLDNADLICHDTSDFSGSNIDHDRKLRIFETADLESATPASKTDVSVSNSTNIHNQSTSDQSTSDPKISHKTDNLDHEQTVATLLCHETPEFSVSNIGYTGTSDAELVISQNSQPESAAASNMDTSTPVNTDLHGHLTSDRVLLELENLLCSHLDSSEEDMSSTPEKDKPMEEPDSVEQSSISMKTKVAEAGNRSIIRRDLFVDANDTGSFVSGTDTDVDGTIDTDDECDIMSNDADNMVLNSDFRSSAMNMVHVSADELIPPLCTTSTPANIRIVVHASEIESDTELFNEAFDTDDECGGPISDFENFESSENDKSGMLVDELLNSHKSFDLNNSTGSAKEMCKSHVDFDVLSISSGGDSGADDIDTDDECSVSAGDFEDEELSSDTRTNNEHINDSNEAFTHADIIPLNSDDNCDSPNITSTTTSNFTDPSMDIGVKDDSRVSATEIKSSVNRSSSRRLINQITDTASRLKEGMLVNCEKSITSSEKATGSRTLRDGITEHTSESSDLTSAQMAHLSDEQCNKCEVTLKISKRRKSFCGPCQKYFKNNVSLDMHERKYHSIQ